MAETQNYSNHTRWFPLVHFVIFPLLLINLICHIVRFFYNPGFELGFWIVLSVVLILISLAARMQALKAQDRVIRLEERLRYRELLSGDALTASARLTTAQVIALRFASDEELPDLVQRTAAGEFKSSKEIKLSIKNWRPDEHRV